MDYRALVQKLGDRTNQNSQTSELILEHRTGHPTILLNEIQRQRFFLLISNTNGRLDRSNKRIDQLNKRLISAFLQQVIIINTKPLSDIFGDLRSEYTLDGLHFSDEGYKHLRAIVEEAIKY